MHIKRKNLLILLCRVKHYSCLGDVPPFFFLRMYSYSFIIVGHIKCTDFILLWDPQYITKEAKGYLIVYIVSSSVALS